MRHLIRVIHDALPARSPCVPVATLREEIQWRWEVVSRRVEEVGSP